MDIKFPDVTVNLVGGDGNVFAVVGAVTKALKRAGHPAAAQEFRDAAFASESYDDVLQLCMATVNVE